MSQNVNQKITDYIVVESGYAVGLGQLVADKLPGSWQPYGSPYYHPGGYHCQAMVKYA